MKIVVRKVSLYFAIMQGLVGPKFEEKSDVTFKQKGNSLILLYYI